MGGCGRCVNATVFSLQHKFHDEYSTGKSSLPGTRPYRSETLPAPIHKPQPVPDPVPEPHPNEEPIRRKKHEEARSTRTEDPYAYGAYDNPALQRDPMRER